jgi:hypothetical protein
MNLHYAVITEQQHTFAVVLVQKSLLDNRTTAEQAIQWLQTRKLHMPTALVARDEHGNPCAYYGRGDLALLLARIPPAAMAWQEVAVK